MDRQDGQDSELGINHGLHGWARIPLRPNRASQRFAGQEATAGQVGPQS